MGFFRKSDLEERVRKLESGQKELALEWELAYEKLLKLMGRIAKRAEPKPDSESPAENFEGSVSPDPRGGNGAERTATGRLLTPHQREIQQRILRRRAGG